MMNVYRFEVKQSYRRALLWAAILLIALFVFIRFVFPVYTESRAEVEKVLSGFPPQFAALFGMNTADIFSYGGFYSFCSLYLLLCGAIMAAGLGLAAFAREKRAKCDDFLFSKPIGRGRIFAAKLLAALSFLVLMNLLYVGLAMLLYRSAGQDAAQAGRAFLAASALFLSQLVILAAAVFIAVFARKIRSVSAGATAIAFTAFVLSAFDSLLKEPALRYITPLKYFDAAEAFSQGQFDSRYALTGGALFLLLLGASYYKYCHADVHAA